MTKQSRWNESMRRDGQSSQSLTNQARNIDRLRQRLPQAFVFQGSAVSVECRVVGHEPGGLVISGSKLRLAAQSLRVRRRHTEVEGKAFNLWIAPAPVGFISFEFEAYARLKLHYAKRASSHTTLLPTHPELLTAFRNDGCHVVRNECRKERDWFIQLDCKFVGRVNSETNQVRLFSVKERLRATNGRIEEAASAFGVQ